MNNAKNRGSNSRLQNGGVIDDRISYNNRILDWDKEMSDRMAVCSDEKSKFGSLRPLMRLLEYSCHGVTWLVFTIAWIVASHQIELQEKLLNLLLALIVDLVTVGTCKAMTRRQRPLKNMNDAMTILVDKYSFPSGHTTRATLVTLFFLTNFSMSAIAAVLFVFWSLCVSVSRVLLGRHHITDVISGIVIGCVVYITVVWLLWIPRDVCSAIIRPIQEELHL